MQVSRLVGTVTLTLATCSIVGLVNNHPSQAAIINGGFETGNFRGWQRIGNVSIVGSEIGTGPQEGNFQALLTTGEGAVSVLELEAFLGLSPGSANLLTGENVVQASAIKQIFTAKAGDVFTLDFNFLTNELTRPDSFADDLFFGIGIAIPTGQILSAQRENISIDLLPKRGIIPSNTPFVNESGFVRGPEDAPFVIPFDGTFIIGLGVVDVDDADFDSAVLLDNITITTLPQSVPEPTSSASLGMLGLAWLLRGKFKKSRQESDSTTETAKVSR